PFDPKSKSPARPHLRIIAHIFEDLGMNHAATSDLEPFLPHLARERAAEIDLEARFGIAEVVWAETDFGFRPHQLLEYEFDRAFEIAHRDVAIHIKTFDLVEGGIVRGVGIVAAVNPARDNDSDRRALLFHHPNLDR